MPELSPEDQALAARLRGHIDRTQPFQAWLDAGCPWPADEDPPQTEPAEGQLTLDLDDRSAA